jgi:hypothetical protein
MAMLIPTKFDTQTGLPLNIVGIPQRLDEPTFNSYLLLKQNGHENHTLTLGLKIFMKQHDMSGAPSLPHLDYDKKSFFLSNRGRVQHG